MGEGKNGVNKYARNGAWRKAERLCLLWKLLWKQEAVGMADRRGGRQPGVQNYAQKDQNWKNGMEGLAKIEEVKQRERDNRGWKMRKVVSGKEENDGNAKG